MIEIGIKKTRTSLVQETWEKKTKEELEIIRSNMKSPRNKEKIDRFIKSKFGR